MTYFTDNKKLIKSPYNKTVYATNKQHKDCYRTDPNRAKRNVRYNLCTEVKLADGITQPDQDREYTEI